MLHVEFFCLFPSHGSERGGGGNRGTKSETPDVRNRKGITD